MVQGLDETVESIIPDSEHGPGGRKVAGLISLSFAFSKMLLGPSGFLLPVKVEVLSSA